MLNILSSMIKQGKSTAPYPKEADPATGVRGRPQISFDHCTACDACAAICPTQAISLEEDESSRTVRLSLASCIFCGLCEPACPEGAITITPQFELATLSKHRLQVSGTFEKQPEGHFVLQSVSDPSWDSQDLSQRVHALAEKSQRLFGHSLHLRAVDAGSCNGCELEISALQGPVYDFERLGIHLVASPRHADGLLITGPVTRNMREAVQKTYDALPGPKLVIAVGACACGGGLFQPSYTTLGAVDKLLPVDVYIPGCPPRPQALIHGLLMAMGRMEERLGTSTAAKGR